MPRYKQVWNEELGKSDFIEIGVETVSGGHAVFNDLEPFVSPVDGSVISDRKQLREHNLRHNVVNTAEFGTEHWDIKRKERERFFNGEHTPQESLRRKQELYEKFTQAERNQ